MSHPPTSPPNRPDGIPDRFTHAEQARITWETPGDGHTVWVWRPDREEWFLGRVGRYYETPTCWWGSVRYVTGGHGIEVVAQWRLRPFDTPE